MKRRTQLCVGIVGYKGANAQDIVGPAEVFSSATFEGSREPIYEVILVGLNRGAFTSDAGIQFKPTCTLSSAREFDIILLPGGSGIRNPAIAAPIADWIRQRSKKTRVIASVCTGVYGLAQAGLLDGRTVTTHWRFAKDLAARYPNLKVDPGPIFIRDGKFITSAGVTAGIDLALAIVEEDCGRSVALAVARDMVVYLKRSGGQEQFSEPLQFQIQAADRFNDMATWIAANLRRDLSVEALAAKAALCPRHFRRRFKSTFGRTPALFIEGLRLGEARRRLVSTGQTMETIATSVGFGDADSLRRVFRRRFGIAPGDYRNRFNTSRVGAIGANLGRP